VARSSRSRSVLRGVQRLGRRVSFGIPTDEPTAFCAICGAPLDDEVQVWTFLPERVGETRTFPIHEACFRRVAVPAAVALLDEYGDQSRRVE
jgi:hypothetical protein